MRRPQRSGALAIVLAFACDGAPAPQAECTLAADCGRGERCVEGECISELADSGSRDATQVDMGVVDAGACAFPIQIVGATEHCTVQEAIDRATPGDVVRMPAGRFTESIVISTALTLEGEGSTTILAASGAPTISIAAANVIVRNLDIESGAMIGVEVLQQGRLESTKVRGTANDGILVRGSGIATLAGVHVLGMGVRFEAGATGSLAGTIIESASGTGLLVEDGARVVVEMASLVTASIGAGIVVFAADFEMRDSESSENGPVGSDIEDGLWLSAPTRSVVERSTFSQNRGYGIFCSAGVVPTVCMGNVFSGNQLGTTNCAGCN